MPTAFPLAADPFSSGSAAAALSSQPSPLADLHTDLDKGFEEFSSKIDAATAEHDAKLEKAKADNQRIEGDFFAKNAPPAYKPQAPYAPPKETTPLEAWGSLAMGFAMLASHFTRTPMTTAMNAGAAVMKAFKEQDADKAKQSYEQYKDAVDQSHKLYEYQRDAYKDLLESVKDRIRNNTDLTKEETADYRARITALGTAFKDKVALEVMEQNGVIGWAKHEDMLNWHDEQTKVREDEIDKKYAGKIAVMALAADPEFKKADSLTQAEQLVAADPAEPKFLDLKRKIEHDQAALVEKSKEAAAKIDMQGKQLEKKTKADEARQKVAEERLKIAEKGGARTQPLAPEQIEENARLMVDLKLPLASPAVAARNNTWEQTNLRAFEIAKEEGKDGFSAQWYDAAKKQRLDAAAGPSAKGIRYLTVSVNHLDSMEASVMALPNGSDIRLFNKMFVGIANQINNSDLAEEEVKGDIVGNEIAKAISGAGNLSVDEREKLSAMFDPSRGKESLLDIIHAVRELLGGQVAGYATQFSHYTSAADMTGIPADTMRKLFIDPDTGSIAEPYVQWDRQRVSALLAGRPAPPMPKLKGKVTYDAPPGAAPAVGGAPQGALKAPPGATSKAQLADGSYMWLVNNQWVKGVAAQ